MTNEAEVLAALHKPMALYELQQRVDDINSAASTLQSRLETQYAKYQAAIESANSTLDYLKALLNSSSSN